MRHYWRIASVLALLVIAPVTAGDAAAPKSTSRDVVGTYRGHFTNADNERFGMVTRFEVTASGDLAGRYSAGNDDIVLGDDAGTLELFRANDPAYEFRWRDRWGSGILFIKFAPDYSRFEGTWTFKNRVEGEWTGERESR